MRATPFKLQEKKMKPRSGKSLGLFKNKHYILSKMISYLRNIFATIALGCGVTGLGAITLLLLGAEKYLPDLLILSTVFTIIIIVCIVIFVKGLSKTPQNSFWYTFVSIGIKLLLEMILAVFWFVVAKKSNIEIVFMFFILYLPFTLFLILTILKTLNKKSL